MGGSLYDRLGAGPDASAEELRAAHRERARRLHPDSATGDAAAMRGLNEAWAVLSDAARRAAYDRTLRQGTRSGVDAEPAGSGGKTPPAGPGGKTPPAGPGGKTPPAGSGGKVPLDGNDDVPRVRVRMRLWPFLVLGAGLLVVLTAYAGRPADSQTQGEPVGQCLVEGQELDRTEPCRSVGGTRIVAVGGPGVQCPAGTDVRALRGSADGRRVCLSRVAGR